MANMVRAAMEREFPKLRKEQERVFRLALNEAEALAWETPVPMLVFPMLAYEKLKELDGWHRRQKRLRSSADHQIALAA